MHLKKQLQTINSATTAYEHAGEQRVSGNLKQACSLKLYLVGADCSIAAALHNVDGYPNQPGEIKWMLKLGDSGPGGWNAGGANK